MSKIRISTVILVFLVMLGLIAQAIDSQSYLIAASLLCAGLACITCVMGLSCPWDEYSETPFKILVWFALMFSITHVFFESELTQTGRQEAQINLSFFFGEVQGSTYGPISPTARVLAKQGLQLCGVQGYLDMSKAALELQKAYYLGPGSTLALGAYESWLTKRPKKPTCLSTFVDFSYQAPEPAKSFLLLHKGIEEHLLKQ